MKKADIDQIFNSAPDIPMKDAWTPLPKDARGSKYSGDTIRVTGTPEFIKSVLDALDIATLKDDGMGIRTTILPAKSTTINGKPKDFQDLLGGRDAFACYLQRWENGSGGNRLTSMGVAAEMVLDTTDIQEEMEDSPPPSVMVGPSGVGPVVTQSIGPPKLKPSTRNGTSKKAKLTAIKNTNVTYDRVPETSEILVPTGTEITDSQVRRTLVDDIDEVRGRRFAVLCCELDSYTGKVHHVTINAGEYSERSDKKPYLGNFFVMSCIEGDEPMWDDGVYLDVLSESDVEYLIDEGRVVVCDGYDDDFWPTVVAKRMYGYDNPHPENPRTKGFMMTGLDPLDVNQLSIDIQSLGDPVDLLEMIDSIEEDLIESMGNEVEDLL